MNKKLLKQFTQTVMSLQNEKELDSFLKAIFTPKELEELPMRLEVIRLLKKGVPQRVIAQKLKVGVATVTRGSHELQKGGFKDIF